MGDNKIDITSTAIEKGIDLIGGFIEKLAGSTLEEAGLMFGDKMRVRRLKNQIKIFSDVQKMAEENNISIKQINLKALVPLLEYSSLEEDETLQQKWSNLILNFSDASQVYESSIYPFILSQLAKDDIVALQHLYNNGDNSYIPLYDGPAITKANLLRLGVIEIADRTKYQKEISLSNSSKEIYHISELGKDFYKCCTIVTASKND
ncbi:hypothetical protein ACFSJW_07100 [Flavobacterium artemisiae]|uniref:DUF4393 domain-containing protein n=1 Tax=Flavobacterium artemisiae TaxID=2126556 RepID=A0ABW4HBX2_9FLAO